MERMPFAFGKMWGHRNPIVHINNNFNGLETPVFNLRYDIFGKIYGPTESKR